MKGPYNFELHDDCNTCTARSGGFFCQLSPAPLEAFDAVKSISAYPQGAILFCGKADAARRLYPLRGPVEALGEL